MADKDANEGGPPLPPKLDLRKSGVIKPQDSTSSEGSEAEKQEKVSARPASSGPPASKVPSSMPPTPVPAHQPTAGPKSTTAPIVMPKPGAGTKPVVRPSSAGPKVTRPSSSTAPAGATPVRPKIVSAEPPAEAGQEPSAKAETSRITLPAAKPGAPATARPKPAVAVSSKKDTTKIPLEAAKPKPVGASDSKKPPSSLLISSPGETARIPAVPKPKTASIAAKRKTARIPLEAALGEDTETGDSESTPKTIRIRKPGGAGPAAKTATAKTIKAKPVTARTPGTAAAKVKAEAADKGGEAESPTRRKTVVVKRAQTGGAKNLAISRAKGVATPAAAVVQPVSVQADEPGALTGIMALAAVLVASALIYMLAAQVIGPDRSQISYATGAPDLPFPGKIQ
jgi:hypothetical protein